VVDVKEPKGTATAWAEQMGFTFPVLLDEDGTVAATYAPKDLLPDLPRDQVPIASNLIIDKDGKIQFYSLLDSRNFDAKLIALKKRLDDLLAEKK
jgi:peroxiredoxin